MLLLNKVSSLFSSGNSLSRLEIVGTNSSTSSSVTCPAGTLAGDFIIYLQRAVNSVGIPSTVTPTNFTNEININNGSNAKLMIDVKLAVGGEASSSITGMNGNSSNYKTIIVVRGNKVFTGYTSNSEASQITDGNPTAQVCTSGSATSPCIMIANYSTGAGSAVSSRSFTGATEDAELSSTDDFYTKYKIFNSNPANITVDTADDGTDNGLMSCYFTFTI